MVRNYLTIGTYCPAFLAFHRSHAEFADVDYEEALGAPMATCLRTSGLHSTNTQLFKHEVL